MLGLRAGTLRHDPVQGKGSATVANPAQAENGAGDGDRTRDPKLGKLVLYQLSYARLNLVPIYAAKMSVKAHKARF